MKFILQYPQANGLERDMLDAGDVGEMAAAAEKAGFDGFSLTEHPIPGAKWLAQGGHQSVDPFVALAFAAAATTRLRLLTYLAVVPYRNPFLLAKASATLDRMSNGRFVLGVGSGYHKTEFFALGVDFEERNALFDEALEVLPLAWSGEAFSYKGRHFEARNVIQLPRPTQRPIPIWIGGNSKRAIRRAVDHADGWMPMPSPAGSEARLKTPAIASLDALKARLDYAHEYAAHAGRQTDFDVIFMPTGLDMFSKAAVDPGPVVEGIRAMAEVGVTYCSLTIPGDTRAEYLRNLDVLAEHVVPAVADV